MTDIDGRHDFDFLLGQWTIKHRFRVPDGWSEFETSVSANPLFGGLGNLELMVGSLPSGKPFEGMSVRLFDPAAQVWRVWWASSSFPGQFGPPVEGGFADGIGTFSGEEDTGGKIAKIRVTWQDISPTSARWSQAYSYDQGETWEDENWIMEFTR